jgi:hypothetical protein
MSDDEVQRRLAELRAEVAALSAARGEAGSTPTAAEPAGQAAEPATGAGEATARDSGEQEHSQIDELLELLEAEIKDLPTITCLIVFSLGILMGRFLR